MTAVWAETVGSADPMLSCVRVARGVARDMNTPDKWPIFEGEMAELAGAAS